MSEWSRRELFRAGAGLIGGVALLRARQARADEPGVPETMPATAPASAPGKWPYARRGPRTTPAGWRDYGSVLTPNGGRLPWHVVGGVKVFHLIAEAAEHQLIDGLNIEAWTYNGRTPGPTIEVMEGDRCRFYVTNRLSEPTTVHWHGIFVPNGMDGVAGLTQRAIAPGETYVYEFTMNKPGTFMYHPHYDEMTQIALGMQGMIIVHPRATKSTGSRRVRDHALMLNEWKVAAGTYRPDALEMTEFNMLTINSKSYPSTAPILAEVGDLIRLRIGNLSPMEHHPIHLHGHAFEVVETDGGSVPPSARRPETTVLVPVGTVRVVEFVAERAGDWALHCHMTHHAMNQMGHKDVHLIGADVADAERQIGKVVPGYMAMDPDMDMDAMQMPMPENSVPMKGAKGPFGFIGMGGMFTILKVRQHLEGDQDPGWYEHPAGTVASGATKEQLSRDGIELPD